MTFPTHYVARVVEKTRAIWGNTQQAIDVAADSLDLPAEDVARIAANEAQANDAAEPSKPCQGCGACKKARQPVEA